MQESSDPNSNVTIAVPNDNVIDTSKSTAHILPTLSEFHRIISKIKRTKHQMYSPRRKIHNRHSSAVHAHGDVDCSDEIAETQFVWSRCWLFGPIFGAWALFMIFLFWGDSIVFQRNMDAGLDGNSVHLSESRTYGRPVNEFEQAISDKQRWDLLIELSNRYVPHINDYVNSGRYTYNNMNAAQNRSSAYSNTDCLKFYTDIVSNLASNINSDPADVKKILTSFKLDDFSPAIRVLGPLLTTPQPLTPIIQTIYSCASTNRPLMSFFCALYNNPSIQPKFGVLTGLSSIRTASASEQQEIARRFITYMMVVDALCIAARESQQFYADMIYRATERFMASGDVATFVGKIDPRVLQFAQDKFKTIEATVSLQSLQRMTMQPPNPDIQAMRERYLQANILEAAYTDYNVFNRDANANAGLVLAHYVQVCIYECFTNKLNCSIAAM
jgi:hypothetical protein